jgi:hypothetical protein
MACESELSKTSDEPKGMNAFSTDGSQSTMRMSERHPKANLTTILDTEGGAIYVAFH